MEIGQKMRKKNLELRKRFMEGETDLGVISTQTAAEGVDPALGSVPGTQQSLRDYLLNN